MAVTVACVLGCDPNGNNQPECTTANLNVPIRNFYDPTHYWQCNSAGAVAESVPCPVDEGFDGAKGACVAFSEWKWVEPCPEEATN